ncbi:MAG: hypothetical protein COA42_15320 [Alteromonadaceae bacterium]|nr:MAG: hypothetical protein COA42_15320 [Alteromonadaceae bacterium]
MAKELKKISEVKIDGSVLNIANVTAAFGKYGLPEPKIGNHVYLSSGFESHNVYSSAYDLATTRIWMWGRKNRKVFDKEHKDFFDDLASRRQSGFDFRVLFLDPESSPEIISKAHKDEDFSSQLEKGIDVAQSI